MFVVLKLVEASASWREQDDIARSRRTRCNLDRALNGSCLLDRHAPGNLLPDLFRCSTNEKRQNSFFAQRLLQYGVVAALILASENDQNSSGKCIQRFQRGVHVGSFRIVVITHTANFCDKLKPVLDSSERTHANSNPCSIHARKSRRYHRCQNIFQIVFAYEI